MDKRERKTCLVCGQAVTVEAGISACYEGQRCSFCSAKCQAKFEADPERYVGATQCLSHIPPGYW